MKKEDAADIIHCRSEVSFGWADRLRILINGRATVRAEIFCEKEPGGTFAESVAYAPRLFPSNPSGGYAIESPTKENAQ